MDHREINISELLKDVPEYINLYSPICGECNLINSCDDDGYIVVKGINNGVQKFYNDGRYRIEGEPLLFPSKEVRDWGCFRVKYTKGVTGKSNKVLKLLKSNGGTETIEFFYTNETCLYYIDSIDHCIKVTNKDIKPAEYDYILSTGTELKLEEEERQTKFKKGDEVIILNERQTGSTPTTHIVDEEIDGVVYMDNYRYGMFVGSVALAKAKEQPKFKVGDVVCDNKQKTMSKKAKNNKAKVYEFENGIYPRKLWVATGDVNEVIPKFEYTDGTPITLKEKGYSGVTIGFVTKKEQDMLGVLVYIRRIEKLSQVIHEAIHVANKIFQDLSITFNLDEDEHYAYFVEWVCDCIDKVRTNKVK